MTQNKTIQEVIETTDIRTDDGTTKTFPQYMSQHILINDHVLIIIVLNAARLWWRNHLHWRRFTGLSLCGGVTRHLLLKLHHTAGCHLTRHGNPPHRTDKKSNILVVVWNDNWLVTVVVRPTTSCFADWSKRRHVTAHYRLSGGRPDMLWNIYNMSVDLLTCRQMSGGLLTCCKYSTLSLFTFLLWCFCFFSHYRKYFY